MLAFKKSFSILLLIAAVLHVSAQFGQEDFAKLHALKGIWKMQNKKGKTFEIWKVENDTLLSAISYRVFLNRDTTWLESVTLSLNNGKITYTPQTFNQNDGKPVVFTLVNISGKKYSFENKAHDFPQLITYDLKSRNQIMTAISGSTQTEKASKTIDFPFTRVTEYGPEKSVTDNSR